jgi:hypothetical protein
LSCFNLAACPPADFQALIQFLIEQICALQGLTPGTDGTKSTCPDCVVSVATCLRNTDPSLPATMQLLDYVQLLANKICTLIDQVSVINTQITNIDARVTVLENTPPPTFTIPSIETGCLIDYIPGTPASTTIDVILNVLLNNNTIGYCALIDATGFPAEILSAVQVQCIDGTSESLANPGDTMSDYPDWIETPFTAADAITNLWVALCDVYNAVDNISLAVEDTNTIDLTFASGTLSANIVDTGWVNLNGFEFYAASQGKPQCRRIGNVVHFRGAVVIPLEVTPGGTPLEFNGAAASNTYITQTTVAPSETGAGSVFLDTSAGAVYFNANASVIPSSVVAPTASGSSPNYYFDNTYVKQFTLGTRGIVIKNSANAADLISTVLNTFGTLFISKEGKLGITTPRDSEESNVSAYQSLYSFNTSHLNYIVSHVVANEFVSNFQALNTTVHSSAASGVQTVDIDHTQSSSWTIARSAPTVPKTYQYRFSFNGNDVNSLGGVSYALDGLMAYIDPCTTDIKEYICNK